MADVTVLAIVHVLSELLYAYDLVLISEIIQGLRQKNLGNARKFLRAVI